MFLLYYRDFFEQICSDVQFISPPEEVGEFLLHLLKQNGGKQQDEGYAGQWADDPDGDSDDLIHGIAGSL